MGDASNDGAKSDKLMQKKQKLMAKQEKLQQKVEKIVSKKDKKAPVVIDEQQLLDDIANAAVKDLGLNEDQKQEPVLSSLSCVCGSFIPSSGVIYHCPNLQSVHHPEGYDLCPNCVEYQKQFEKQPSLKKKVEKVVPIVPKEEEFKYKQQLEQLRAMGFNDDDKIKKELIEQKGNVQRVANRLLHTN